MDKKIFLFFLFALPISLGILVLIFHLVRTTFLPQASTFPLFVIVVIILALTFERWTGNFFDRED